VLCSLFSFGRVDMCVSESVAREEKVDD